MKFIVIALLLSCIPVAALGCSVDSNSTTDAAGKVEQTSA